MLTSEKLDSDLRFPLVSDENSIPMSTDDWREIFSYKIGFYTINILNPGEPDD